MKAKNPSLLIQAMLAEEDDIFNTLLCRAAKCTAEAWSLSPQKLQLEIRDRIWNAWLGWVKDEVWVDRDALCRLGRVDRELRTKWKETFERTTSDSSLRIKAAQMLGEIGSADAVPVLVNGLKDTEYRVAEAAASALGKIGGERSAEALLHAMEQQDGPVLREAALSLSEISLQGTLSSLIRVQENGMGYQREAAALALTGPGFAEAIPALIAALKDGDRHVREQAAATLGGKKAVEAIPELIKRLRDDKPDVRMTAAWALGEIGSSVALPELLGVLHDKNVSVIRAAAEALGKIGSPQSRSELVAALKCEIPMLRDIAAEVLGEIRWVEAVPELIRALHDKEVFVRNDTALALARIGTPEAVTALKHWLKEEHPFAIDALPGWLDQTAEGQATSKLVTLLIEKRFSEREATIVVLGGLGASEVVPELIKLLGSASYPVQEVVGETLAKLATVPAVKALFERLKKDPREHLWRSLLAACKGAGFKLDRRGQIVTLLSER